MQTTLPSWVWVALPFLFTLGWILGRHISAGARRLRAAKAQLEQTKSELELVRTELELTQANLQKARNEAAEYRSKVAQHFSKTADLFNTLTLNYRAVYEHLAVSAVELCDEHVVMISDTMPQNHLTNDDGPSMDLNKLEAPNDLTIKETNSTSVDKELT